MENKEQKLKEELREALRQKDRADKYLLRLEIVLVMMGIFALLSLLGVALLLEMEEWMRATLIVIGVVLLVVNCFCGLWIERVAGYYECKKCGNRYVPNYSILTIAPHLFRTRYMRCPHCNQLSWQKKVIGKADQNGESVHNDDGI